MGLSNQLSVPFGVITQHLRTHGSLSTPFLLLGGFRFGAQFCLRFRCRDFVSLFFFHRLLLEFLRGSSDSSMLSLLKQIQPRLSLFLCEAKS